MSGDLRGNDALAHVLHARQAQVLGGGHVAQEVGAVCRGDRAANGRRNVVVARRDIGHQRPQHVERRVVTQGLLDLHVGRNFVERHVSWALDHDLYVALPCARGKKAQLNEFAYLARVGGVAHAARAQRVAERNGHVVLVQNIEQFVVVLEERVLVARHFHPGVNQAAAAAHDVHHAAAALEAVDALAVEAGVNRHEVHAFFGMRAHNVEEVLRGDVGQVLFQVADGVVHRNGADHRGRHVDERAAEIVRFAVIRQVHNGFGVELERRAHLLHLAFVVAFVAGNAQVHVDFRAQPLANAMRVQRRVVVIGGNGDGAARDAFANNFGVDAFVFGNLRHLRRNDAELGGFHLG